MVDGYMANKVREFEDFFFAEYGPVYRVNWMKNFEAVQGYAYSSENDFGLFYNDLVAEYQELVEPIHRVGEELRASVESSYRNALDAHEATGAWLAAHQELTSIQRQTVEDLLSMAVPGLSLDRIDEVIGQARALVEARSAN